MALNIDYGKILNRSFQLTKRYKWLWVYGLTLAAFAGGSGGTGGNSNFSSSLKNIQEKIPEELPDKTSYVLGQITTTLKDWFSHVPMSTWILLGIGIFSLVVLWVFAVWIIRSWAMAGLIYGVELADRNQEVTLINTSPHGLKYIKHLIIFSLISIAISLALILLIIGIVLGGYLLFTLIPPVNTIWLITSGIVGFLTFLVLVVIFAMLTMYAERLIVLKNYTPWQAWKKGLSFSRHHFLPTVVMGIINMAIGCAIGCISMIVLLIFLGIPTFILIIPLVSGQFNLFGFPFIAGLILIFFTYIYISYLISALLTVFKYSNWNLLFKEVIANEDIV